jgi:hypothetical protein
MEQHCVVRTLLHGFSGGYTICRDIQNLNVTATVAIPEGTTKKEASGDHAGLRKKDGKVSS